MSIRIGAALAACAIAAPASSQTITITFENLLPGGGTAFTPVFLGLSDGSFDLFDPGGAATPGLEALAELGATGTLGAESSAAAPSGQYQATTGGPILGGGSASAEFVVTSPSDSRYLTFATMVVPTNDLFIGNGQGIELFDAKGNFNGPLTIDIFGSQVWDAGTEVNNADNGAAFLQGIDGTAGADQGGTVQLFFNDANASDYLDSLVGRTTAPGFDIASVFDPSTQIARITIVPAPAAATVLGIAGLGAVRRRR